MDQQPQDLTEAPKLDKQKLQIGGQRRGWVKGGAEWTVLCRKHSLYGIFSIWFQGARARSKRSRPGLCIAQHFFFFNFTILYWFCHISTWICHRYTRVPHPEPSSLPVPSLWVIPVHQPQASSIMHRTWTGDSFHIWYYTCFSAILPNHPTLSLSHRVQRLFYTSVSLFIWCFKLLLLHHLNLCHLHFDISPF